MAGIAKHLVKPSLRDAGASADRAETSARNSNESNGRLVLHSDCDRPSDESLRLTATKILGVDELSAFFNCSTEKIKRLARRGELPAFKFGKTWFVRERDLETYIARRVEPKLHP